MLRPDGGATVDFSGKSVLSCGWDKGDGFRLGIGDADSGEAYELHVGPFTLEQRGQVQHFDPRDSATLPTDLFDRRVVRAEISINGTLTVHFADGAILRCDTQTDYEAWQLIGPKGLMIVAVAGADSFAFWGPR
jgi:hypothetical protein